MKITTLLTLLCLLTAPVIAQSTPASTPIQGVSVGASSAEKQAERAKRNAEAKAKAAALRKEKLGFTDAQEAQLTAIQTEQQGKLNKVHAQALPQSEKQKLLAEIAKETNERVQSIYTPEQLEIIAKSKK